MRCVKDLLLIGGDLKFLNLMFLMFLNLFVKFLKSFVKLWGLTFLIV